MALDQRPLYTVNSYRVIVLEPQTTEDNLNEGVKYSILVYHFIIVHNLDTFGWPLLCTLVNAYNLLGMYTIECVEDNNIKPMTFL